MADSPVWPDGKKHPRNVYAKTREECEQLLAEMILQMKAEIAAEKERLRLEKMVEGLLVRTERRAHAEIIPSIMGRILL